MRRNQLGIVLALVLNTLGAGAQVSPTQLTPVPRRLTTSASLGFQGGTRATASQSQTTTAAQPASSKRPSSLNSQTGRAKNAAIVLQRLKPKLGPPKPGPRVKSPASNFAQTSIIAVLKKQRQAAEAEFAQMRAAPATPASGSAARLAVAPPRSSGTLTASQPQPGNSPAHVESEKARPSITQLSPSAKLAPCNFSNQIGIATVAGAAQGAILSADAQANLYTITGCNFGNASQGNKAYIYGKNGFHVDFQIQFWSSTGIAVNFAPQLSGIPDTDNVSLVIHRVDGQESEKGGFKFYAARETVSLGRIPSNRATLAVPNPDFPITTSSPAADAAGYAYQVARLTHADIAGLPPAGKDSFDVGKLAPGFYADSANLEYWNPDAHDLCGAWDDVERNYGTSHSGGAETHYFQPQDWNLDWQGDTVQVSWSSEWCSDLEATLRSSWTYYSQYAVQVWVTGPRGFDPLTGQPSAHK